MPRKKKDEEVVEQVIEPVEETNVEDLDKLKQQWFKLAKNEIIGQTHHLTKRLDELTEKIRNYNV